MTGQNLAEPMPPPGPPYPDDGAHAGGLRFDDDVAETRPPARGSASVSDATERVIDATRGIVLDHIALILLEARTLAQSVVRGAALIIVGALLLAATWGLAMATLYAGIGDAVPAWMRLAGITSGNALIGVALVAIGLRALRRREAAS